MRIIALTLAAGLILSVHPGAQTQAPKRPLTKEQLEHLANLEEAKEQLQGLEGLIKTISRKRVAACTMAFGHGDFCACLDKHLAIGADFDTYIEAVTKTKEEIEYSKLDAKLKALVDSALTTREQCVVSVWR
jgi:hypothetical protein